MRRRRFELGAAPPIVLVRRPDLRLARALGYRGAFRLHAPEAQRVEWP
jgi:hypothetical protein